MKPLDIYEELINWICPDDKSECCTINFSERKLQEYSGLPIIESACIRRSKVLCCHDMKGGYLDDNIMTCNDNVYAYRFYNWHLIDTFIYFSHHFVTIPPLGWTLQAHKNGVQCLGTLIIEPGDNIDNFLKMFDSTSVHIVAGKLDEIRRFYNFDGWLINIECSVEKSLSKHVVANICAFLNSLKKSGNEVIWYDAITEHGELKWQNCLNSENRIFYDNCRSIFTNYCWKINDLRTSLMESVGHSNGVFVGIDCFGRGCPGGGGFNCDVALKMIDEAFQEGHWKNGPKLSIALFANGWCYDRDETMLEKVDLDTWQFYDKMHPHLYSFLDGRTIYRQLPEIYIYENSSFQTNFDIGQGYSKYLRGDRIEDGHYNNLMDQQVTPSGSYHCTKKDITIKILPCRTVSYSGYSCMVMVVEIGEISVDDVAGPIFVELFRLGCHMRIEREVVMHLWLGQLVDVIDEEIWSDVRLKLSFSMGHLGIQSFETRLEDVMIRDRTITNTTVHWYYFHIDRLSSRFNEEDIVTLRKIDLVIANMDTLHRLKRSPLYFGLLRIESMD